MKAQNKPDISKMSKDMLRSELNALYYSLWTPEDYAYRDKLVNEYNNRIEDECAMEEVVTFEGVYDPMEEK